MKLRLPLYGRVLAWFALNLVLLAALLWAVARSRIPVDTLLEGLSGERIQRIADVLVGELRTRPQAEWNAVIARANAIYGVEFVVLDERETVLAGTAPTLPDSVRARLLLMRGGRRQGPPPMDGGLRRPMEPGEPPPGRGPGFGPGGPRFEPPPRSILRAGDPPAYWAVIHSPIVPDGGMRPVLARLVIRSERLIAGGVFLDPKPWVIGVALVVLVSALWWGPFVGAITRAIRQMTQATETIAQGRFDTRVDEGRGDELGRMGGAINQMAGRLEVLVSGQKRFLGDIAHELCSPLARMEMALGVLEQRSDPRSREYVDDVRDEVRHMSALVNELLSFSKAALRPPSQPLQEIELAPLVAEVLRQETSPSDRIELALEPGMVVAAEPGLLKRALANLIRNALRHAGDAGPIRIEADTRRGAASVRILDEGPGVPPEALARLGEPFYRPDSARTREKGGAGLGLAIVRSCVEACRGELHLENREPRGFSTEIRLAKRVTT